MGDIAIRIKNGLCQSKKKKEKYRLAIVQQGTVAFFYSKNSLILLFLLLFINFPITTIVSYRIFECRSPTAF